MLDQLANLNLDQDFLEKLSFQMFPIISVTKIIHFCLSNIKI